MHPSATRIIAALAVVTSVLSGCQSTPQATNWSLGGADAGPRAAAAANGLQPGLQIRVGAAPWLNQSSMSYVLDYKGGQAVESYASNQWVERPAVLLEDFMLRAFAQGQTVATGPVSAQPASTGRRTLLFVRLLEFTQHFATPQDSELRIAAVATLNEPGPGGVRSAYFRASAPAPQANAAGGAAAAAQASDALAEQIFRWVQAQNL
jgi:cholesterol transport system auxiliary component